jgi:hypothetical protein
MSDNLSSERPARRRAALYTVLAITVLLLASLVLVYNLGDDPADAPKADPDAPTIAFAQSVAGYTAATDTQSQQRTAAFQTAARKDLAFNTASVIVYAAPGAAQGTVLAVAASTHDNGRLRDKLAHTKPGGVVRDLLVSAELTGSATYPTAPLDGTLECGTVEQSGASTPVCAWVGHSTIGVVMDFTTPAPKPATLAVLARAIRVNAEH